jgi:replicative DNA helicase
VNLPLHHDEVQGAAALPLPHNIEAEQSLLGAILINNEALQRVIAFLQPEHFFEPIHKQVYDVARTLIGAGKVANPVTLKTFLPADIAGLPFGKYLARLAAEAISFPFQRGSGHCQYMRR